MSKVFKHKLYISIGPDSSQGRAKGRSESIRNKARYLDLAKLDSKTSVKSVLMKALKGSNVLVYISSLSKIWSLLSAAKELNALVSIKPILEDVTKARIPEGLYRVGFVQTLIKIKDSPTKKNALLRKAYLIGLNPKHVAIQIQKLSVYRNKKTTIKEKVIRGISF